MENARPGALDAEVVRARRFEVVDSRGRVRAVLGDVGTADSYAPGLALLDGTGSERSCYALFSFGPSLDFASGGNGVLNVGVADDPGSDDDADYDPVVYIVLSDGEGDARVSLRVHRDGRTEFTRNTTREPGVKPAARRFLAPNRETL